MISNINVESFIEQENCYICMEKTYSRSPCECQTPICDDCFQIEKDRRNYNCSICKYDFKIFFPWGVKKSTNPPVCGL